MINDALQAGDEALEATNIPVHKNEPRYCSCNGVSYGEMIKCDNPYVITRFF